MRFMLRINSPIFGLSASAGRPKRSAAALFMRRIEPSEAQMNTAPPMWAKISSSSQLRLCSELMRFLSSSDIARIASESMRTSSMSQRGMRASELPLASIFAARVSSAMGLPMPRATSSDAAIENARAAPASASISTASIRWARARSSSGTEMRTQNGYVPSGLAFPAGEARYSIRVFIVCE